jgi:hypothetical protein
LTPFQASSPFYYFAFLPDALLVTTNDRVNDARWQPDGNRFALDEVPQNIADTEVGEPIAAQVFKNICVSSGSGRQL